MSLTYSPGKTTVKTNSITAREPSIYSYSNSNNPVTYFQWTILALAGIWTQDLPGTKLKCYQLSYPGFQMFETCLIIKWSGIQMLIENWTIVLDSHMATQWHLLNKTHLVWTFGGTWYDDSTYQCIPPPTAFSGLFPACRCPCSLIDCWKNEHLQSNFFCN